MLDKILIYFLLFILYSFVGWSIETINFLVRNKRFVNRGFLIGPYCPIYGIGSVFMTLLLTKNQNDPFGLFVKAMVICALLEYFTSYIMEKLFKMRWWDYSKYKFNINGRICLETMIMFGIGGLAIIYIANPILMSIIEYIPNSVLIGLDIFLITIFLIDNIVSFNIINSFKNSTLLRKDYTEEVSKKVKQIVSTKSYLMRRLKQAFPSLIPIIKNEKNFKKIEKQKDKIKKDREKLKELKNKNR